MINVTDAGKRFVLHNQGGTVLPVMSGASLHVGPGECVALTGASGAGKSTLMRMIWGNYRCDTGSIRVAGVELNGAAPRDVLALRRDRLGYVSQFLRVIPRVPTLDVVAEPLAMQGMPEPEARAAAEAMLTRLNIPQRLWGLSPTTFSGGEQQRVNIARGFIHNWPVMLLDEPTASLDAANRAVVLDLISEAKASGAAILGIFHDLAARQAVCDRRGRCASLYTQGAGSMSAGRLVVVVGPSGVGKDTLIGALAEHCPEIVVARRVITRAAGAKGEDHDAVSEALFDARLALGALRRALVRPWLALCHPGHDRRRAGCRAHGGVQRLSGGIARDQGALPRRPRC